MRTTLNVEQQPMALVMRLLGHCRLVALHRASACARSCSKLGHTVVVIPALWVRALLFASAAALVSAASALIASFGRTPCQLTKTRARGTRGGRGHPQSRARTLQLLLCGVLGCSVALWFSLADPLSESPPARNANSDSLAGKPQKLKPAVSRSLPARAAVSKTQKPFPAASTRRNELRSIRSRGASN